MYKKLGFSCLFPKFLRPFQPLIERLTCKLGLDEDDSEERGFMKTSDCNPDSSANPPYTCTEPSIENKIITRSHGLPNMDFMIEDDVSTYDDCFPEMTKATYGSRVLAKLVDDVSCEDTRYQTICQEQSVQNRVLFEEDCRSPG